MMCKDAPASDADSIIEKNEMSRKMIECYLSLGKQRRAHILNFFSTHGARYDSMQPHEKKQIISKYQWNLRLRELLF